MSNLTRHAVAAVLAGCAVVLLLFVPSRNASAGRSAEADAQQPTDKYWLAAKEQVYRTVPEILAQHRLELSQGLRFHKLMHGDRSIKQVALTFDDGPHPAYTPKILAILNRFNVKATFFLVGEMAEKYPDLVRAEVAAGHSIANHTYHHVNLLRIPPGAVATEIQACGDVLQAIAGRSIRLFRPPGGDYNRQVAEVAEALGYTTVLWTDDPGDYANPGKRTIEQRVLRAIGNGGIILVHDGIQQTVDVLPTIIRYLKRNGYQFVTVDEMLKRRPREEVARAAAGSFSLRRLLRQGPPANGPRMPVDATHRSLGTHRPFGWRKLS